MARILVIDDTSNIRLALKTLFTQLGHEVMEASNGEEAARLYAQAPPDLIITDLLMPGKDGMEVLLEVRYRFPKTKIIAMSSAQDLLPAIKNMGAHRTIAKPFKSRDILAAVHELLGEEKSGS